jgi:hypothetical protein
VPAWLSQSVLAWLLVEPCLEKRCRMGDSQVHKEQVPVEGASVSDETTRGAGDVGPVNRSDRGEGTMERDEAMAQIGPAGERDVVEDIQENRERGGENPGRPEEYRNKP